MTVKIRFTPTGKKQFLSALSYIHRDDPQAALRFRRRTEKVLRRLERHPKSGRALPEFPNLPYREVIIPPYRFFYRVESKTVWVVAAWHSAQLPLKPIK